jgi:hypothetical protein
MIRDPRYKNLKNLISSGHIKLFREVFDLDVIPKSVVARDLGINNVRFSKLMVNVHKFAFEDMFRLAAILDVEEKVITDLVVQQYILDKKNRKKKLK